MFIVHWTSPDTDVSGNQVSAVTRDLAATADDAKYYIRTRFAHLNAVSVNAVFDCPQLSNNSAGLLMLAAEGWLHDYYSTQGESDATLIGFIADVAEDRDYNPNRALGAYALMFSKQQAMPNESTREVCEAILAGAAAFDATPRGIVTAAAAARQRWEFSVDADDEFYGCPGMLEELRAIAQEAGASTATQQEAEHLLKVFRESTPSADPAEPEDSEVADWIVKHDGAPPLHRADGSPAWNPTARQVLTQCAEAFIQWGDAPGAPKDGDTLAGLIDPFCVACGAGDYVSNGARALLAQFAAVAPEGATQATIARTIIAAHA